MQAKEKRQLENELMKMGLAGLDSPEFVGQIADIINHWHPIENKEGEWIDQHKFLRDLLNECEAGKRQAMYDAIVPHLNFKAMSLAQYEAQIAERAGRMISQRRMRVEGQAPKAVEIGGHSVPIVSIDQANACVATVSCHNCPTCARFIGDTAAGAMIEARKAGWMRDPALNKETCPACVEKTRAQVQVSLGGKQVLTIKDLRRVN